MMPHELTANEKKSFWSAVFSYCTQQRTISRSGCDVPRKVDYSYDNQRQLAQWLDQEEASKHLPKPNSDPQCSWSLFGGVLVVWFSEFFLNPGKIITSEKYAQWHCEPNILLFQNPSSWVWVFSHHCQHPAASPTASHGSVALCSFFPLVSKLLIEASSEHLAVGFSGKNRKGFGGEWTALAVGLKQGAESLRASFPCLLKWGHALYLEE